MLISLIGFYKEKVVIHINNYKNICIFSVYIFCFLNIINLALFNDQNLSDNLKLSVGQDIKISKHKNLFQFSCFGYALIHIFGCIYAVKLHMLSLNFFFIIYCLNSFRIYELRALLMLNMLNDDIRQCILVNFPNRQFRFSALVCYQLKLV